MEVVARAVDMVAWLDKFGNPNPVRFRLDGEEEEQESVLHTIEDFMNMNGKFPTIRELGILLGLKSTSTVSGYVGRLKEKGYLGENKLIKQSKLSER